MRLVMGVSDILHDLGVGEDVQDPGEGVPAVPAHGHGARAESCLPQTWGRFDRQWVVSYVWQLFVMFWGCFFNWQQWTVLKVASLKPEVVALIDSELFVMFLFCLCVFF